MRLNPTSGYLYFMVLGRAYFFLGNLEQARINLKEASKRNPEYLETHVYLAALEVVSGGTPSAGWEADQIRALEPAFSAKRWLDSYPMTDNGQKTKLRQALDPLGLWTTAMAGTRPSGENPTRDQNVTFRRVSARVGA